MQFFGRVGVVVAVSFVLLIPIAGASQSEEPGQDAEIQDAPIAGRADGIAAWSVDSGGGESAGGNFSLVAAVGQPDAGLVSQCGTVLVGGLWAGAVDLQSVFCDGFESGSTGSWSVVVGGTE